jgi:hypothetical protein
MLLVAASARAGGPVTILDCTFDDKPIDEIIGTGGPTVGEPVRISNADPHVRAFPFQTPCIEILDENASANTVAFEFLNGVEIAQETVVIEFSIAFDMLENYLVYVREAGTSTFKFLNILLGDGGEVYVEDEGGSLGMVGTYDARELYRVRIRFDWDPGGVEGEYAIDVNDVPLVTGRRFISPEGIGAVYFGNLSDGNAVGTVYVDDVLVRTDAITTSVEPATWGGIKALWR